MSPLKGLRFMGDKIKALSKYRIEKAIEDLESAEITLQHNKLAQSTNRSYYAIFHAVRALLAFDKFDSKRHSSIIGYFNQNYIASEKIDKEYYRMLASAFEVRTKSDYQDFYVVSKYEAEAQLESANKFIEMIQDYIEKNMVG